MFDVSVKNEEKLITPLRNQTHGFSSLKQFTALITEKGGDPAKIIEKSDGCMTTWQVDILFDPSEYSNYLNVPLDAMSKRFAAVYSHRFVQYAIIWHKQYSPSPVKFSTNKFSVYALRSIVTDALLHPAFYTENGDLNPKMLPIYKEWEKVRQLIDEIR